MFFPVFLFPYQIGKRAIPLLFLWTNSGTVFDTSHRVKANKKFKTKASPPSLKSAAVFLSWPLNVKLLCECFQWRLCRFLINTWPSPPTKVYQCRSISTQSTRWPFPNSIVLLFDENRESVAVPLQVGNWKTESVWGAGYNGYIHKYIICVYTEVLFLSQAFGFT